MYLGIEIGGTKLQLGVGPGDGVLVALERRDVDVSSGADGIRQQIAEVGRELVDRFNVRAVGYGFGGPLDVARGATVKSHQVAGWENFPLAAWTVEQLDVPVVLNNDCDAAALAEARFGAGRGKQVVFYVTVGTGVGGGLVADGQIHRGSRAIAAEIGHLRPGLDAVHASQTVESMAAGPGISATARRLIESLVEPSDESFRDVATLEQLCHGNLARLSAKDIAAAAHAGNWIAREALSAAIRTLGWAIAQAITLVAPEVVVVGGGVSLIGDADFFAPLRQRVAEYVFPPLLGSYLIVPAALGEEVVVHGALAAARDSDASSIAP